MPRFRSNRAIIVLAAFTALSFMPDPAHADAIDGDWCSDHGRRISIAGPSATTPKGVKLQGNYTRHTFSFTMPDAENDAGAAVEMVLQGETQVRVLIGPNAPEIWKRCPPGIS
ncbi:MAG: hypothetical protein K2X57_06255 [Xanthobacteraceae bacterium]|nr:hypothetical protein [Xanthobacteraceae bacterium]MBY0613004.1 hypothetical protein [Beijerinckiaceae bacterium]